MQAAYWNIKVHKDDKHKTTFITKYGLFEHNRLPFGLCNSPATFSRVIQLLLQGLTWVECLAYLDDILVLGSDFEDHVTKLGNVLSRFKKYKLKLKPNKCQFFRKEVKFLGRTVTGNGINITPDNVSTMKNWPVPTNVKQVESFLGFINYHRDHVEHFAELVEPLYQLTRKNSKFCWLPIHQEAFENLKDSILNATMLNHPDPDETFILDTDASDKSKGAKLSQIQDDVEKKLFLLPVKF
jgi:hypothetical protein